MEVTDFHELQKKLFYKKCVLSNDVKTGNLFASLISGNPRV